MQNERRTAAIVSRSSLFDSDYLFNRLYSTCAIWARVEWPIGSSLSYEPEIIPACPSAVIASWGHAAILPLSVKPERVWPASAPGSLSMVLIALYSRVNISCRVMAASGANLLPPTPLEMPNCLTTAR